MPNPDWSRCSGRGMFGSRCTRTVREAMSPPTCRLLPVAIHSRSLTVATLREVPSGRSDQTPPVTSRARIGGVDDGALGEVVPDHHADLFGEHRGDRLAEFLLAVGPGQDPLAVEHPGAGGQDRLTGGGHGRVDQRERGQAAGEVPQDRRGQQRNVVGPVGRRRPTGSPAGTGRAGTSGRRPPAPGWACPVPAVGRRWTAR